MPICNLFWHTIFIYHPVTPVAASSSAFLPVTPVAASTSSAVFPSSASSSATLPVLTVACQPVDEAQQAVDKVQRIGLPVYSSRVAHALESGNVIIELDKCIEETAYHILRHGDMNMNSDFAAFGRKMHESYPCIQFNSRLGDSTPWVSLCTVHHCVIMHIDQHRCASTLWVQISATANVVHIQNLNVDPKSISTIQPLVLDDFRNLVETSLFRHTCVPLNHTSCTYPVQTETILKSLITKYLLWR